MSVSLAPFVVEKRFGGVKFLDLPCLTSGRNSNLTSYDMADLWRQGIAADDDNKISTENIPDEVPQPEDSKIWKSEGIICLRRSNNFHNTYVAFKNYSSEEVMTMTNLEVFSILFPIEYITEAITSERNNLLKHPMEHG